MLRHVESNLDSERAGILRSIDDGNDTCADGDHRQGDLIQRTVWVAWRKRKKKVKVKCGQEPFCFGQGLRRILIFERPLYKVTGSYFWLTETTQSLTSELRFVEIAVFFPGLPPSLKMNFTPDLWI